jgi:glycogen operon protein
MAKTKTFSAVLPGKPYPLGATWDGQGVNFAVFSEHAEKVELCLFDERGRREVARFELPEGTNQVWHGYLPEARPHQLYGYRVYGPYRPEQGLRFNHNKLLLDPYAKSIVGNLRWSDAQFGYIVGSRREDLSFDRRNSASGMLKSEVIDPAFTWGDDRPPQVPWHETVIYEAHVRGFTKQHPDVPPPLRGRYAALATPPIIDYLRHLGVTAVELLPVHAFIDDRYLLEKGLSNYWGYNTIGFFAPEPSYAVSDPVNEFKTMVRALHAAGIEVILDVVFNHTAEGNQLGPTFAFRGLDNSTYYRLEPDKPRYYHDYTGCGNTLNTEHAHLIQFIADCLRYWVLDMHVDGFRFDLAVALGRKDGDFNPHAALFTVLDQDPVLSQVKLIAEPWDVGDGGYQLGHFPGGWAEWNGNYRDVMRDYWRGEGGLIGDLAYRLTGSSDLYQADRRRPYASVNFITVHDGFTLQDLVSYNDKHNEANGEDNRDGASDNRSWNCGAEGATDDPEVRALRARQKRNFVATLMLSQGVPMLLAGDEIGHTQQGNNNAYCQDNELAWFEWELNEDDKAFLDYVRALIDLRKRHPIFRRRNFFQGRAIGDSNVKDVMWLNPDGPEMSEEEWHQNYARCLGMRLAGASLLEPDTLGRPIVDDDFLLLLNAHYETIDFTLPSQHGAMPWGLVLDTAREPAMPTSREPCAGDQPYPLQARSLVLLCKPREELAR